MISPDFIIAGVSKAGTGALRYYLSQHPEIWIAPREIHYFDTYYDKDMEWYQSHFDAPDDALTGEKSPSYMASHMAAERMHMVIPEVKLIFLIREPVSRAYSAYWFYRLKDDYYDSFRDAMEHDPRLKAEGEYSRHIDRYREYYPEDQLLFMLSEHLRSHTQDAVKQVLQFLEVNDAYTVPDTSEQHATMQTDNSLYRFLLDVHNRAFDADTSELVSGVSSVVKRVFQYAGVLERYPPLDEETRAYYEAYFEPYNEALQEKTDLNLDVWRHNGR